MVGISTLIPKITDQIFSKNLKVIGAVRYEIVSDKSIVIFGGPKSRPGRKEALNNLADLLTKYNLQYINDTKISGAGYVLSAKTNAKIFLKPDKAAGGLILKPGLFGTGQSKIVDVDIPFSTYYNRVANAINTTKELNDIQKEILTILLNDAAQNTTKSKTALKKIMPSLGSSLEISTINNDFGEVLGPLAIASRGLLPIQFTSAKVFIPGRSNEPLLDYKISDKTREYKISAKSGESTNTLKPGDVIKLISEDPVMLKRWKKTPEWQVITMLTEGTWKQGPIDTAMWLKNNGYKSYFTWMKTTEYTEESRQKSEDGIVQISRNEMDFTPIFRDATTSKVYYIKFRMSVTGEIEWKHVESVQDKKEDKKTQKRIAFRSKNYIGRPNGDKLGFQV